jgi:hypothetical protein
MSAATACPAGGYQAQPINGAGDSSGYFCSDTGMTTFSRCYSTNETHLLAGQSACSSCSAGTMYNFNNPPTTAPTCASCAAGFQCPQPSPNWRIACSALGACPSSAGFVSNATLQGFQTGWYAFAGASACTPCPLGYASCSLLLCSSLSLNFRFDRSFRIWHSVFLSGFRSHYIYIYIYPSLTLFLSRALLYYLLLLLCLTSVEYDLLIQTCHGSVIPKHRPPYLSRPSPFLSVLASVPHETATPYPLIDWDGDALLMTCSSRFACGVSTLNPCPIGTYGGLACINSTAACYVCPAGYEWRPPACALLGYFHIIHRFCSSRCIALSSLFRVSNGMADVRTGRHYCPSLNLTAPIPCSAGTYAPGPVFGRMLSSTLLSSLNNSTLSCRLCPVGTYSSLMGAPSLNNCSACPLGYDHRSLCCARV